MRMRGFTLIEILVALGIVVAMLYALAALVKLSALQDSARFEELALTIASSNLEELRAGGYAGLPTSGVLVDDRLSALPGGAGTVVVAEGDNDTREVTVLVSWITRANVTRELELSTIIAENGGLL